MATIATDALTLSDWAKRLDPDGAIAGIAELLAQTNDILLDALYKEGNLPVGHRLTVRTGLPTPVWRKLNQGVKPTKSQTAQITEQIGMLEAWGEVDEELAALNGNTAAFRLSEASAHIEGMNQEMAQTLFFGNSDVDEEEFMGFAPRYSDLGADNGQNIGDGGGTGSDNTSIWLIGWGPETIFKIFPKGSTVGLSHKDLGLQVIETTAGIAGERMMGYRDQWKWKAGLAVKDWRYAVRIANVDVSDLTGGAGADLTKNMIKALHRLPNLRLGKLAYYMNRTAFEFLDIQRRDDVISGGGLKIENFDGVGPVMMFRGIPIRKVDVLTETEARVV